MPYDLTMCTGGECPEKQNCLRSTGAKFGRVDFFGTIPYNYSTKSCDYYMSNRPGEEQIRIRAYQNWLKNPESNEFENWLCAEKELIEMLNN